MTLHLAIIPGGWTAFVLAESTERGVSLRHVESFELGRIVATGAAKSREITEADILMALGRIIPYVTRADDVVIEWATSKVSPSHRLARALLEAGEAHGRPTKYARKWRIWEMGAHRAWATSRASEIVGWPTHSFEVQRDAAAMLLESIAPSRPNVDGARNWRDLAAGRLPVTTERTEVTNATLLADSTNAVETLGPERAVDAPAVVHATEPTPSPVPETQAGTREAILAGVDPGSAHLGIVVARGTAKPLELLYARTIAVGETVTLAHPRTVTRKDGSTYEQTTRHSLTPEMVDRAVAEVVAILSRYGVTRLAIEHNVIGFTSEGSHVGRQTELNRALWVGAEIRRAALGLGIEVVTLPAVSIRSRVAGKARKAGVPDAVRAGLRGWTMGHDHVIDAGATCLALIAPPPAVRKVRERSRGKSKEVQERAQEKRREKRVAKRVDSGCTCGVHRGRHRKDCPRHVARAGLARYAT